MEDIQVKIDCIYKVSGLRSGEVFRAGRADDKCGSMDNAQSTEQNFVTIASLGDLKQGAC